jgi:hypothetical protein
VPVRNTPPVFEWVPVEFHIRDFRAVAEHLNFSKPRNNYILRSRH